MNHRFSALLPCAALLAASCGGDDLSDASAPSLRHAGSRFETLDPPGGAEFIEIWDINDHGEISGTCDGCFDGGSHGLIVDRHGSYRPFDFSSDAAWTSVRGIDDHGGRVGFYALTFDGASHGFVTRGGALQHFDWEGADETQVLAINDRGDLGGAFNLPDEDARAWVWLRRGEPEEFDVPGASLANVRGINERGDRVGRADDQGYFWHRGRFTWLAVDGADVTVAEAINDEGEVAGRYEDDVGMHGFLWRDGEFVDRFDVPGSLPGSTHPAGLNDAGDVVGTWTDTDGLDHGFLRRAQGRD